MLRAELAQCLVNFDVRVDAGLEPPKYLENGLIAVDQRGIGLLASEHQAQ